ncbi:MAG TPA: FISUMP domain-containing protein, partial [Bacteroidales bacterium]|nr:FISUMP domain-containing protein [Bacteroidales bacterium]
MRKALILCLFLGLYLFVDGQNATVRLKVFLQGAYAGNGTMNNLLNAGNRLPLAQPYNTPIWNYDGSENLSSIPAQMVDWVLVDLRTAPDTAIARKALVLYTDGTIRDLQGDTDLSFSVPPGSYYVAVMHRSHLSVMTASKVSTSSAGLIDFTDTASTPVYGRCLMQLAGGAEGMIAGDINHDKTIKYSGSGNDRVLILQRIMSVLGGGSITSIINGYYKEDLRMDGNVKYSGGGNDPSLIIQNLIGLTGSSAITVTFTGPVPHAVFVPYVNPGFQNCGDLLTDSRDGQQYPTVLIGNQCWMASNLNVGDMVNSQYTAQSHSELTNNGTPEKYCYNNDSVMCTQYGGLYGWDELMDYGLTAGAKGICPDGWHVPTDDEWKLLEGNTDTQFGVGNAVWNNTVWRGFDAGKRLKKAGSTHWSASNNGTDALGFTAVGGGDRAPTGSFEMLNSYGHYWTSSPGTGSTAWVRSMYSSYGEIYRGTANRLDAYSVRCLMDTIPCSPLPDQANAGADTFNVPATSVQLQANAPSAGSGSWTIVSGTGGSFADSTGATTLFTGSAGESYILAWTITTLCGSSSDSLAISLAPPVVCDDTLTDIRDGQKYPIVQIGNQCWMGKNLNYGLKIDSEYLGYSHSLQSNNMVPEKYCYNNDEALCTIYGGLYEWGEAMDYQTTPGSRGLCPEGWRVPTDQEWDILTDFLGGASVAGGKLKDTGLTYWNSPNTGATNITGFSARGAAYRMYNGSFNNLKNYTYFYTSNDTNGMGITRTLYSFNEIIHRNINNKSNGLSVRCIQDFTPGCAPQPDPAHAGTDTFNVPAASILLQGNLPIEGQGHWIIVSGNGGILADSTQPNTLFSGIPGEEYLLAWIISNACGYNTSIVRISFATAMPFTCGDTLTDLRDGRHYPTTQIGNQCWMAANLDIGTMVPGSSDQQNNGVVEKYCYADLTANCATYGGLYQWGELMTYDSANGGRGLCPEGWHVPTDHEWTAMTLILDPGVDSLILGYSGTDAGGKMKATGSAHWTAPNFGATNYSGFSAYGSGVRNQNSAFEHLNNFTFFWSSSLDNG